MADTTVKFTITADNSSAVAAVKETTAALKTMGTSVKEETSQGTTAAGAFSSSLSQIGTIAASMGVAFAALKIGQIIQGFAEDAMAFQREWMRVSVILRDTPIEQVNEFKQAILDMDPALGTASQKAAAFYQAISSGFTKPAEAMTLMNESAIAASGGFTKVETALRSGAAVLNAYGLSASSARGVFDIMSKTVDLGVVTFEELASVLGNIIPIAAANHVSFGELSAAIAALTLQGLPAAEAVTGLRSVITSLEKPHSSAIKTAERLGIQWDANILQAKGLTGVLAQLSGRTDVTTSDIASLTGRVEAANAVMALTSKAGAAAFASSLDAIGHASEGVGANMASHLARMQTLSGQLDALKNTFTAMGEGLGDTLVPALKSIVSTLNDSIDMFRSLADAAGSSAKDILSVWTALKETLKSPISIKEEVSAGLGVSGKTKAYIDAIGEDRLGFFDSLKFTVKNSIEAITEIVHVQSLAMRGEWELAWSALPDIVNKNARAAASFWNTLAPSFLVIPGLEDQVDKSGMDEALKNVIGVGSPNAAAAMKAAEQAAEHRRQLTEKEIEEQEKLRAEWSKAIHPLDALVESYKQFAAVGADVNKFAHIHAQEIVNAAKVQEEYNGKLTPFEKHLRDLGEMYALNGKILAESIQPNKDLADQIERITRADTEKAAEHWEVFLRALQVEGLDERTRALMDFAFAKDRAMEGVPGIITFENERIDPEAWAGRIDAAASEANQDIFVQNWNDKNKAVTSAWNKSLKQMSTAATDFGKSIADLLFGQGTVLGAVKQFGKSMVRALVETLFSPLTMMMQNFGKAFLGLLGGKGFDFGKIFAGMSLPGMGGAGGAGGLGRLGGLGGLGGALAFGVPAASLAGITSGNAYGKAAGWTGMGLTGIAGIGAMMSGIPFTAMMSAMFTNPITAAIFASVIGGVFLAKALKGKNAYQAGAPEIGRDFGGVSASTKEVKDLFTGLGLSESQAYPIRKDIFSSPKVLSEFLYPLAQAQGKTEDFLASLEHVTTAWGTFDFRKPFEEGLKSGDYAALNDAFQKAWGPEALSHLGAFGDKWRAVSSGVKEGADEAADAIDDLAAATQKTLDRFGELVAQFQQTLKMTPELLDMIEKFGGRNTMAAFTGAMKIPGLREMQSGFAAIRAELKDLLPLSPFEQFTKTGTVTDAMREKILAAGGNVEAFERFGKLRGQRERIDTLAEQFKSGGQKLELEDLMKSVLGRDVSVTADNVNALIVETKQVLDQQLRASAQSLASELDKMDENLTKAIKDLSESLTHAIDNLAAAIRGEASTSAGSAGGYDRGTATSTTTGRSTGIGRGGDFGFGGETGRGGGEGPGSVAVRPHGVAVVLNFTGPTFGFDDFENRVSQAVHRSFRRGGLNLT